MWEYYGHSHPEHCGRGRYGGPGGYYGGGWRYHHYRDHDHYDRDRDRAVIETATAIETVTTIETAITKAITTTIEPHVAHIRSGPRTSLLGPFLFVGVVSEKSQASAAKRLMIFSRA